MHDNVSLPASRRSASYILASRPNMLDLGGSIVALTLRYWHWHSHRLIGETYVNEPDTDESPIKQFKSWRNFNKSTKIIHIMHRFVFRVCTYHSRARSVMKIFGKTHDTRRYVWSPWRSKQCCGRHSDKRRRFGNCLEGINLHFLLIVSISLRETNFPVIERYILNKKYFAGSLEYIWSDSWLYPVN